MWVDGLDPLREHGVGVVIVFRFLAGHIGQHNYMINLSTVHLNIAPCATIYQIQTKGTSHKLVRVFCHYFLLKAGDLLLMQ